MNESDFYRVARVAGALFWPALLAMLVYFGGRALAQLRPAANRPRIRRWSLGLAAFLFVVSLALSVGDLVARFSGR